MDKGLAERVYKFLGVKPILLGSNKPPTDHQLMEFVKSKVNYIKRGLIRQSELDSFLDELENIKTEVKRRRRLCTANITGAKGH